MTSFCCLQFSFIRSSGKSSHLWYYLKNITLYFLGTDVIVQAIICEPLKALMLLCGGNLSDTNILMQICCSKPLKALILWCRGALFSFQFWDGKQNLVPNMWQVVFANVSIEGLVVDSDVCDTHENSGIWCSICYISYIGQCDLNNTCFGLLQVWYTPGGSMCRIWPLTSEEPMFTSVGSYWPTFSNGGLIGSCWPNKRFLTYTMWRVHF